MPPTQSSSAPEPDPVQQGEERLQGHAETRENSAGVEPRETERRMWVDFSRTQPDEVLNVTNDELRMQDWLGQGRTVVEVVPAEHLVAERARADAAERERDALKEALEEIARWHPKTVHVQIAEAALDPSARAQSPDTGRECVSAETGEMEHGLGALPASVHDPVAAERARLREELRERVEALWRANSANFCAFDVLAAVDEVLGGDGAA